MQPGRVQLGRLLEMIVQLGRVQLGRVQLGRLLEMIVQKSLKVPRQMGPVVLPVVGTMVTTVAIAVTTTATTTTLTVTLLQRMWRNTKWCGLERCMQC